MCCCLVYCLQVASWALSLPARQQEHTHTPHAAASQRNGIRLCWLFEPQHLAQVWPHSTSVAEIVESAKTWRFKKQAWTALQPVRLKTGFVCVDSPPRLLPSPLLASKPSKHTPKSLPKAPTGPKGHSRAPSPSARCCQVLPRRLGVVIAGTDSLHVCCCGLARTSTTESKLPPDTSSSTARGIPNHASLSLALAKN